MKSKLKELPYDVSRCQGILCEQKDDCARYTSPGRENYQCYIIPYPEDCEYYIPNKLETKI